jgi:ABC-type anion transport system duplicated permease subunit
MTAVNSALEALQTAAGVSSSQVSVTVRSILLVLVFVWAAACVYSKIHHFRHHDVDMFDVHRHLLRILFIVAIAVILVFIR